MSPAAYAGTNPADARAGIDRFNQALDSATRRMDNDAAIALWEEDGISLLPSTPPIAGRKAIGEFIARVTKEHPGARMEKFEMQCHEIDLSGDSASEWCTEHQIVNLGDGKAPFEGWGKMVLVLHRDADAKWRIKAEMWNQAPPATP